MSFDRSMRFLLFLAQKPISLCGTSSSSSSSPGSVAAAAPDVPACSLSGIDGTALAIDASRLRRDPTDCISAVAFDSWEEEAWTGADLSSLASGFFGWKNERRSLVRSLAAFFILGT